MPSGYKIQWSVRALADLENIIDYLKRNWTEREVRNFAKRLDKRLKLIAENPRLFPMTRKRVNVRKSVLTKHTVIYYQANNTSVIVISLFDPRQSPKKLNI